MKCFYLLMQIGHIFNQLLEKGSLLRQRIQQDMGQPEGVCSEDVGCADGGPARPRAASSGAGTAHPNPL